MYKSILKTDKYDIENTEYNDEYYDHQREVVFGNQMGYIKFKVRGIINKPIENIHPGKNMVRIKKNFTYRTSYTPKWCCIFRKYTTAFAWFRAT